MAVGVQQLVKAAWKGGVYVGEMSLSFFVAKLSEI